MKSKIHNIKFSIPERELGREDVEFKVSLGGSRVGTLKVSKGTLVWVPKDHTYGHKINWTDFDALMKNQKKEV
jgi:hypothetical protein